MRAPGVCVRENEGWSCIHTALRQGDPDSTTVIPLKLLQISALVISMYVETQKLFA